MTLCAQRARLARGVNAKPMGARKSAVGTLVQHIIASSQ